MVTGTLPTASTSNGIGLVGPYKEFSSLVKQEPIFAAGVFYEQKPSLIFIFFSKNLKKIVSEKGLPFYAVELLLLLFNSWNKTSTGLIKKIIYKI